MLTPPSANDNSVNTITDSVHTLNSQTLGYDALDRLTSATSGTGGYGTYGWTWDPVSNIKTQVINGTTTTFTLNTGTNQLQKWVTGTTTENVASTPAGNINTLKVGTTTLETLNYNQANQLSSASTTSSSATYTYGLDGQRLLKSPPGSNPITYQYGQAAKELLAENDLHSGTTADYIYLNGRPIGEVNPTTGKLYFTHTDRLGTPQTLTDSTKTVVWTGFYNPFGDNPVGGVSGTLATQSLRLPGQTMDPETGMNHNGFRDYAGTMTRYVQSDPIGLRGGMNTYQYVRGNPFKSTDRSGLQEDGPPSASTSPYPIQPPPVAARSPNITMPTVSDASELYDDLKESAQETLDRLGLNGEDLAELKRECMIQASEAKEEQQKKIDDWKKAPYCSLSDPMGTHGPADMRLTDPQKSGGVCAAILGPN